MWLILSLCPTSIIFHPLPVNKPNVRLQSQAKLKVCSKETETGGQGRQESQGVQERQDG